MQTTNIYGLPTTITDACPPGTIYIVPPQPRREDYATDSDHERALAQWGAGVTRIDVQQGIGDLARRTFA